MQIASESSGQTGSIPRRRATHLRTLIADLSLFEGLNAQATEQLVRGATVVRLRRYNTLARSSAASSAVHVVVRGRVKLFMQSKTGLKRVVEVIEPGTSFGHAGALSGEPHKTSAEALKDTVLLRIPRARLLRAAELDSRLAIRLLHEMSIRLRRIITTSVSAGSSAERVINFLLARAQPREHGSADVLLTSSQTIISEQLGISSEHLSRIFRKLSDAGLIRKEGPRIHVASTERLREVTDLD